jgi:aryl-phospho-beta-D-glucosidase BglC (GH1 family)
MKRLLKLVVPVLTTCLLFAACQGNKTKEKAKDFPFESFEIMRGTNLAHWLSQSQRRGAERAAFITERDIKFIDSVGFDHVRLPIDEEQMWDEAGNRNEDAFTLMQNCLDWCQEAGLRVVVDLHILRSHHFNEAWYNDMISIFEEFNVAYANWNYKSGEFGIVDGSGNPLQPWLNIVAGKGE